MNGKKIVLILILVFIICGVFFLAINASSGKREEKVATQDTGKLNSNQNEVAIAEGINAQDSFVSNAVSSENAIANSNDTIKKDTKSATVSELKTGTKYSVSDNEKKSDIIVGDNYYDTTIADINTNFSEYEGKTIEIEGLYVENQGYTFVGRYSTSNLCPNCPAGYSYFEYEWHGDKDIELEDSESLIKVIGTLKAGNDGVDYYYIDCSSIEVMKEKGQDTINN